MWKTYYNYKWQCSVRIDQPVPCTLYLWGAVYSPFIEALLVKLVLIHDFSNVLHNSLPFSYCLSRLQALSIKINQNTIATKFILKFFKSSSGPTYLQWQTAVSNGILGISNILSFINIIFIKYKSRNLLMTSKKKSSQSQRLLWSYLSVFVDFCHMTQLYPWVPT